MQMPSLSQLLIAEVREKVPQQDSLPTPSREHRKAAFHKYFLFFLQLSASGMSCLELLTLQDFLYIIANVNERDLHIEEAESK